MNIFSNIRSCKFSVCTNGAYGAIKIAVNLVLAPLVRLVHEKASYGKFSLCTIGAHGAAPTAPPCTNPQPYILTFIRFLKNDNYTVFQKLYTPRIKGVVHMVQIGAREKWEFWGNVKNVVNNFPHWAKRKCQLRIIPLFRAWFWTGNVGAHATMLNLLSRWKRTPWEMLPEQKSQGLLEESEEWLDRCYDESGYFQGCELDKANRPGQGHNRGV